MDNIDQFINNNINEFRRKKNFIWFYLFIITVVIFFVYMNEILQNIYLFLSIIFGVPFVFYIINDIFEKIYTPRLSQMMILNLLRNSLSNHEIINENNLNYDTFENQIFNLSVQEIKEKLINIHQLEANEQICNICMINKNELKLNCSQNGYHGGCLNCIAKWTKKNNSCHECRAEIININ